MNICNTRNSNDRTNSSIIYFYFIKTIKFIKLADFYFFIYGWIMMVYKESILINTNRTILYFTDTDSANILIIVDCTDKNLCICIRVTSWSWDMLDDGLQGEHPD